MADGTRKGWTSETVGERNAALDRMDRNVPGTSHSEAARRLSRGRWELGPFGRGWVSRRRRARAAKKHPHAQ